MKDDVKSFLAISAMPKFSGILDQRINEKICTTIYVTSICSRQVGGYRHLGMHAKPKNRLEYFMLVNCCIFKGLFTQKIAISIDNCSVAKINYPS